MDGRGQEENKAISDESKVALSFRFAFPLKLAIAAITLRKDHVLHLPDID